MIWATVCQSQHEVKTNTVCQAFITNSDERREARLRRRRERRAAESSEEKEMRLAKRRVADRARYAANSDRRTERRAAESSEQRETRLARRRVADRARFAAISIMQLLISSYAYTEQCVFLILYIHSIYGILYIHVYKVVFS